MRVRVRSCRLRLSSPDSTRAFDTLQGKRTYEEVNDLLAEPYVLLLDAVARGVYDDRVPDAELLKEFHRAFVEPVMPGIAGVWRSEPVQVGSHVPPAPPYVDSEIRRAFDDLQARIEYVGDEPEKQVEALAFAEAAILNVHPFKDFNGRAARCMAWFLASRVFVLPVARTWVEAGTPEIGEYRDALREFDVARNVGPLAAFWFGHRLGA